MSRPMRGCFLCVRYLQRFTVRVVDVYEWREAAVDGDSSPDEGPQSVGVGDPDPKHLAQISTKDRVSNEKKKKLKRKQTFLSRAKEEAPCCHSLTWYVNTP